MRIGLCLVDQGWQTDVVHQSCRQSEHAPLLMAGLVVRCSDSR